MSSAKVEIVGLARFGLVSVDNDEEDSSYSDSFCANSCKLATRRVSTRGEEEAAKQAKVIQLMDVSMSSIGDDESLSFQDSFIIPVSPIRCRRRSSLDHYNNFQSSRASIGNGTFLPHRKSVENNINKLHNSCSLLHTLRGSTGSSNNADWCQSQQQYHPKIRAYRLSSLGSSFSNDSAADIYRRLSRRSPLGSSSCQFDDTSCSNSFANDSLELQKLFKKSMAVNNPHASCSGSIAGVSVSS